MPRTGENIYKRKDGRWEGRYIKTHLPSGKTVYGYLYARTYRDLKEKMLCQERLKNKPHLSSSPTFQTVGILMNGTLRDLMEIGIKMINKRRK